MSTSYHAEALPERIRSRIRVDECWVWTGAGYPGHGTASWEGRTLGAHRLVYELLVGPIPEGAILHHRCERPACVRPDHLEVVTHQQHGVRHVRAAAPNRAPAQTAVGENIRRLKEESGRSWTSIAADAGVQVRHLHSWASGRYVPRFANLKRLAEAFDVSLDELVKEEQS